ncbi:hypothetical protein S23_39790 [Bradyrhizobium cosmicum]|uniref:Uncharacterized protein n=1 Tax=Bradyrhizobium cosmicum TaxID=1404864 RepID=A0AAI8MEV5_9BRAD|nr:hypothetical protein S23_39790 [Bradyrhizobium cosmicum]
MRLGGGLGRNHRLGTKGCGGRRRLVGMIMVVMIVLAVMTMIMIVGVMVIVIMGMMIIVVIMFAMVVVVMIVSFVLAMKLRIGVQMLAFVRSALGVLRPCLALDRLGCQIGAFDDVAADAFALAATARVAVA